MPRAGANALIRLHQTSRAPRGGDRRRADESVAGVRREQPPVRQVEPAGPLGRAAVVHVVVLPVGHGEAALHKDEPAEAAVAGRHVEDAVHLKGDGDGRVRCEGSRRDGSDIRRSRGNAGTKVSNYSGATSQN